MVFHTSKNPKIPQGSASCRIGIIRKFYRQTNDNIDINSLAEHLVVLSYLTLEREGQAYLCIWSQHNGKFPSNALQY